MRRAFHAVVLLNFVLLAGAGCASRPLVDHVDPGGRSLCLLLDASASMRENDPDRADVAGATYALALAGRHDNLGVLAYNQLARVVVPLRPAGDAAARELTALALSDVGREGSTDFHVALETAFAMLDAAGAPAGSSAIFLTDGLPTRRARGHEFARTSGDVLSVPAAVGKFAARGFRIFAIVVGPEAEQARGYMTQLVAPTGGAVFEVADAGGLVGAFKEVAVQALGYLEAVKVESDGAAGVPPETRRLAFVDRWDSGACVIGDLTRDAKPVDPVKVVRFPQGKGPLAVALVEDPEPGTYRADMGPTREALALLEAAWVLELDPAAPPPAVDGGTRVPLAARLKGDAEAIKKVLPRVSIAVEVQRADKIVVRVPLGRAGERFEGAFTAPEQEDSLTVTAVATITEGGRTFTSRRSTALSVRKGTKPPSPPPPATIDARPGQIDLAGFEEDDLHATVTVSGDPKQTVSVDLAAPAGFSVAPSHLDLSAGQSAGVEVRAGRSAGSGSLVLTATVPGTTLAPARREVALRAERGSVGKGPIDLGTVAPGEAATAPVEARGVSFADSKLTGPEGATVTVAVAGGKAVARPGAKAGPGLYQGDLEAHCGASTRRIPARLEVKAAEKVPATITLQASWGWASAAFDFTAGGGGKSPVFVPSSLTLEGQGGARIDPELDVRTKELGAGRYELRIFAAATLPPGRYLGFLRAQVGDQSRTMDVVLVVKR